MASKSVSRFNRLSPHAASSPKSLIGLLGLCLLVGSGCGNVPSDPASFLSQLKREWNALLAVLSGGSSPLAKPAGGDEKTEEEPLHRSAAAQRAKANAELLSEVFQVVFLRAPENAAEFGSYVDTLNQGASFEGIYNGFTHSSHYRKLEIANPGSSPQALKVFSEELAALQAELPEKTEFNEDSAKPLARAVQPGLSEEGGGESRLHEYRKPRPSAAPEGAYSAERASEEFQRLFAPASIYTLKRVLGEEALKVIAARKPDPEKFAEWYGKWVVRMAGRQVDFGLALRNKADEAFHREWAKSASPDRLSWEVLNRLHRVLNAANQAQ